MKPNNIGPKYYTTLLGCVAALLLDVSSASEDQTHAAEVITVRAADAPDELPFLGDAGLADKWVSAEKLPLLDKGSELPHLARITPNHQAECPPVLPYPEKGDSIGKEVLVTRYEYLTQHGTTVYCGIRDEALMCEGEGLTFSGPLGLYGLGDCGGKHRQLDTNDSGTTDAGGGATLPMDHPFVRELYPDVEVECVASDAGVECSSPEGVTKWTWYEFDEVVEPDEARRLLVSYGHTRFLTAGTSDFTVVCAYTTSCNGVAGFGVTLNNPTDKTVKITQWQIGGAYRVDFSGQLNKPETAFSGLPSGMKFLVPSDELASLPGGTGASTCPGSYTCNANGGFVTVLTAGIGAGNLKYEWKNTNDV